jgi:[ribosomal protein S5]-alanine N-acetyltransferase
LSEDTVLVEGERLFLREYRDDDFEAVHAFGSDPEVVEYLPWGPNTESDTRKFLARAHCYRASDPRWIFELAVVRRDEGEGGGGELIGGIGLHKDGSNAVMAYSGSRSAWGQGYATEAAGLMLDLGFRELDLHRIWAVCDPENTPSASVLRRLGMRQEGHLREAVLIRGEWRDSLIFAILESEWRAGR